MSVIAFDANAVREYSLLSDQGPEKTVFSIGRLDTLLLGYVRDSTIEFSKKEERAKQVDALVKSQKRFYLLVQFGLKGWKGFKDDAGNDIAFEQVSIAVPGIGNRLGLSARAMDMLQPYISELALEIDTDNTISKEQEKN